MKKFMATIVAVAIMTACAIPVSATTKPENEKKSFSVADVVQRAKEVETEGGRIVYNTPVYLGDNTISRYWIAFHNERVVMYHDDRAWFGDVELEADDFFVLGYTE